MLRNTVLRRERRGKGSEFPTSQHPFESAAWRGLSLVVLESPRHGCKAGNLRGWSIRPQSPPPSLPGSASAREESGSDARACARGKVSATSRGLAPARKPPPPGARSDLGGSLRPRPSRTERCRAGGRRLRVRRAEPSGQESVGATASPPPSRPRLRRRRRPPPPRGLRRPAGRPPANREEAWSARRAARPQAPPPAAGERPPRPSDPVCPRGCQPPCIIVCVSPPVSAPRVCALLLPPRLAPGPACSVATPPAPRSFWPARQHPLARRLRPFPRGPAPPHLSSPPPTSLPARSTCRRERAAAPWGSKRPRWPHGCS